MRYLVVITLAPVFKYPASTFCVSHPEPAELSLLPSPEATLSKFWIMYSDSKNIHRCLPPLCEWYSHQDDTSRDFRSITPPKDIECANAAFIVHSEKFLPILGPEPKIDCILRNDECPLFHEAGVYIPESGQIFVTSNQFKVNGRKIIQVSRLYRDECDGGWNYRKIDTSMELANGAVNYCGGILFCEQGTFSKCGGLTFMSAQPPYRTESILTSFRGRWFNSVNDIVTHSDGSIWFTDPWYGFEQHIRPKPQLPNQVYRYDPTSGDVRAVAESIAMPNGLCFSPDEQTLYVTDTDGIHGEGQYDPSRGSSIFAFDVMQRHGAPFLMNRRLFAFVDKGVPDGIKCDMRGNVYSGCGDGVHVWSPGAELIGRIRLPEGHCSNFCFGRHGELFLLNENRVWHVQLSESVQGALLRI